MRRTILWLATGAVVALTSTASGQARRLGGARKNEIAATPAERQAQERRVRQAFDGVVRRQLRLDDQRMRQLRQTQTRFERQRRQLNVDERRARLGLKAAMEDSAGRDQNRISQSIDQLVAAQRRRADLLEAEQKELSSFLTPLQRAQYLSLQERLSRRVQQGPKGAAGPAPPDSLPLYR
jgi:hypothetical protein